MVALAAVRVAEHLPRRVQHVLGPRDRREHVRRGARDQFRTQQGRLILVLPLDRARLGVRHRAEDVGPGYVGFHGASWIRPVHRKLSGQIIVRDACGTGERSKLSWSARPTPWPSSAPRRGPLASTTARIGKSSQSGCVSLPDSAGPVMRALQRGASGSWCHAHGLASRLAVAAVVRLASTTGRKSRSPRQGQVAEQRLVPRRQVRRRDILACCDGRVSAGAPRSITPQWRVRTPLACSCL